MKQAKDFANKSSGETFELDKAQAIEGAEAALDEKVVLNIGRSKEKINFKKKMGIEQTGNFFFDIYMKVNEAFVNMGKVKMQEKATFFRLLAVMVDAGIPIINALNTLADQNKKNKKFQKIIEDMAFRIEGGESLSGSMEQYEKTFNESEIGMIRSGEVSGHLNDILRDLAKEVEKTAKTIAKVKSALTYPVVVLGILFLVLTLMLIYVIPNIQNLFEQTGAELPAITKFIIGMSKFMQNNIIQILLGIVAFVVILGMWKKTKSGKLHWDRFMLHVPITGPLLQKAILAQFARTLGNLLGSGVSITQSLQIISNATHNEVYKRKIKFSGDDIKAGIPLADALRGTKYFPQMLVNMIDTGEQTAQLENVSKKIATYYDEQVDLAVKGLTKVIEPIIMVFVGVAVGGLVAAIMLPILTLGDSVGDL
ncbi:type II secretion system F family protein [Patescibacteria group bacterium]